jgi:hydroxymethylbilane synthase
MIRIGTRGSALARAQAQIVADALGGAELVLISTAGDRSARPIRELGDGVFVTAIEDALRAGEIDVAVHSLKDLPTAMAPDLAIAAIPAREDPRDLCVTRDRMGIAGLRAGMRVGTSSPRRAAFIAALAPGIACDEIRGNVDTRLAKVARGEYDAVVLAAAGLRRLGIAFSEHEALSLTDVPPAPGQGALAVQTRADDGLRERITIALDDPAVRAAVTAEREVLRLLGASCELALGCYGRFVGDTLMVDAAFADGHAIRRAHAEGSDPLAVAAIAAHALAEPAHA